MWNSTETPLPLWERVPEGRVRGNHIYKILYYLPSSGLRPPSPTRGEGSAKDLVRSSGLSAITMVWEI
jgi:hypothetical protein